MADAAAQIIPLYERHARTWLGLRRKGSFHERAWLDRFVAALPAGSSRVLDIGCGGGHPIAEYLVGRNLVVTGVDASATMIGICRGSLPDQEWIEADMRSLALGRRFDGLIAWDSFFHLNHADQRAMFAIFARHAEPGAALMFTSGPTHGEAIGELGGEKLYHSSLAPSEYRQLLERDGFGLVEHIANDPECGGHTVWLCRKQQSGALHPDHGAAR